MKTDILRQIIREVYTEVLNESDKSIKLKNLQWSDFSNSYNVYLPDTDSAHGSFIAKSEKLLGIWKSQFIKKFGDNGIVVIHQSGNRQSCTINGNVKYDKWKGDTEDSMSKYYKKYGTDLD